MKTLEELRQILSPQKKILCDTYQISDLRIFGSYAKGEQTESSDVDFLVDYETAPTLINLVELREHLSKLLELKVDVVTKNALKPHIREQILEESTYI